MAPFDLAGSWEFEAGACCRVDVEFEPGDADAVGLDLAVGGGAATRLRWDTRTGRLALDRAGSGDAGFHPAFASVEAAEVRPRDGVLRLRVLLDRTSVEVFAAGGEVCLTDQVFPPGGATSASVVAEGGTARVVRLEWAELPTWSEIEPH
ncbi:GH32 C-terminal domain-containing protein [Actinokineospora soli]|uniref:GH32 C-terminal domain-containing protein n=1 Tax=Actinokineospora soli TaxID=1048753 RepID=A0ABW2TXZ4_9PSEU